MYLYIILSLVKTVYTLTEINEIKMINIVRIKQFRYCHMICYQCMDVTTKGALRY